MGQDIRRKMGPAAMGLLHEARARGFVSIEWGYYMTTRTGRAKSYGGRRHMAGRALVAAGLAEIETVRRVAVPARKGGQGQRGTVARLWLSTAGFEFLRALRGSGPRATMEQPPEASGKGGARCLVS